MKAVVFREMNDIELTDVPEPHIDAPTDAIVAIETTAMGGLDIHAVHGTLGKMKPGTIIGHEGIGLVSVVS